MTKTLALAAALSLFAATGAFAQANSDQAPASSSTMMKKGSAPKSDAAGMSAPADADAAAKPKAHHAKMAKNEAQLNEQEAEVTKQLNEQQAAQNAK